MAFADKDHESRERKEVSVESPKQLVSGPLSLGHFVTQF